MKDQTGKDRVVRNEFAAKPSEVMKRATQGPVTITDQAGSPLVTVYIPSQPLRADVD